MPFKYNPPTRKYCEVCEKLGGDDLPIIQSHLGKASSANNFPFHNWYNFVLGYTPEFPDYIIERENITNNHFVVDPFAGSGTTLVCCKNKNIPSGGVEANDFFKFAADTKLYWDINIHELRAINAEVYEIIKTSISQFDWSQESVDACIKRYRPKLILEKHLSDIPFVKLYLIQKEIENYNFKDIKIKELLTLAFAAIILPASNVRYGPGFGIIKPKEDVDVLLLFKEKMDRIIQDLEDIQKVTRNFPISTNYLGDARTLGDFFCADSVDIMITSPPYPGDHEYTKHSRLELILLNHAKTLQEFRIIKKRMLRASTTNIYNTDNERDYVKDVDSIANIVNEIDKRLKIDGATSGFEKLYTKLVWEYFGGMYKVFTESYKVLKPGGKFILLVSDSHAFKMVHIETAKILQEIAEKAGFVNPHIELWQYKNSTSHKYNLRENILTLEKPK